MLKLLFLLSILLFSGCTTNQEKLGEVLQSHGATTLRRDFKKISEYLVTYKEKLDLRNPKAFIVKNHRIPLNKPLSTHTIPCALHMMESLLKPMMIIYALRLVKIQKFLTVMTF